MAGRLYLSSFIALHWSSNNQASLPSWRRSRFSTIPHAQAVFVKRFGLISINPSKISRVYLSFSFFSFLTFLGLCRSLLRPCIKDGILAPTQKQRLTYKNWLHVYAKDTSAITPHMASLVDLYKVSNLHCIADSFTIPLRISTHHLLVEYWNSRQSGGCLVPLSNANRYSSDLWCIWAKLPTTCLRIERHPFGWTDIWAWQMDALRNEAWKTKCLSADVCLWR